MRVKFGDLRTCIAEALTPLGPSGPRGRRMSFEDLLTIQEDLDERLVSGKLDNVSYNREWSDVLEKSGWTQGQYERELDLRWDYLDTLGAKAPNVRRMN